MTRFSQIIADEMVTEEHRLARLKTFCAAAGLNFYAANEEICEVVNDSAYTQDYLDPDEVQHRFIFRAQNNFDLPLNYFMFWELADFQRRKKE